MTTPGYPLASQIIFAISVRQLHFHAQPSQLLPGSPCVTTYPLTRRSVSAASSRPTTRPSAQPPRVLRPFLLCGPSSPCRRPLCRRLPVSSSAVSSSATVVLCPCRPQPSLVVSCVVVRPVLRPPYRRLCPRLPAVSSSARVLLRALSSSVQSSSARVVVSRVVVACSRRLRCRPLPCRPLPVVLSRVVLSCVVVAGVLVCAARRHRPVVLCLCRPLPCPPRRVVFVPCPLLSCRPSAASSSALSSSLPSSPLSSSSSSSTALLLLLLVYQRRRLL